MSARAHLVWAAALPSLLGAAGPAERPGPATAPDTLTTAYDVSGLRVIQRVNRATDVVAVRLYLLGGTRQLTKGTAGIEALLLRASEYGTERYPGEEARRAMARTGSVVSHAADADWTVFGFTGLAEDVNAAWDVLADRVMRPTLSDQAVAQARGKLVTRAHARYTDPDERIHVLATQALFPDHPYALDPEGTEASLGALTAEHLKSYAREQIVTSRMLLVIVGNLERAHAESLVAATLGRLPRGDYHWTLPPPAPDLKARWLVEHRAIPTNYMLGYFTGPPATERTYWAFRVATALLSSEIHNTVRTQHSLSYAAHALFLDRAVPIGGAYASTPRPDQVLPLILDAVQMLQQREIDFFALSRFLNSYTFDYIAENATAADQAEFLARAELYLGGYRRGDEFVKRLHEVTPPAVHTVALRYMSRIQYAYLGDTTRMRGRW
ncbi:MAG TPA: pitrilysin family protein [Gemmatimonadales bacterium]|nr:pitrilysin family protein [Gemmatimonadales bacterium]